MGFINVIRWICFLIIFKWLYLRLCYNKKEFWYVVFEMLAKLYRDS